MPARFKLDENLPRDAAALLRDAGHDVHTVSEEGLGGDADARVLDACRTETRILVSFDLDFADIRSYPPSGYPGIWILRPISQSISATLDLLRGALALLDAEPATNRLWIIEPDRVRIRE